MDNTVFHGRMDDVGGRGGDGWEYALPKLDKTSRNQSIMNMLYVYMDEDGGEKG